MPTVIINYFVRFSCHITLGLVNILMCKSFTTPTFPPSTAIVLFVFIPYKLIVIRKVFWIARGIYASIRKMESGMFLLPSFSNSDMFPSFNLLLELVQSFGEFGKLDGYLFFKMLIYLDAPVDVLYALTNVAPKTLLLSRKLNNKKCHGICYNESLRICSSDI